MAYTITYSGGSFTVADGALNTGNTSLALPGRNYAGYGGPVDQDLVSMLENFASANTGPGNPIKGQLWFDIAGGNVLKVNTGTSTANWTALAFNGGANFSTGNLSVTGAISGNTATFTGNVTTGGFFVTSAATSIAATGIDQASAFGLTRSINVVSTGSGAGVRLPSAAPGTVTYITNTTGGNINVYPATGAAINNQAVNTPFVMGTGATIHFIAPSATQWYTTGATFA